jgi:hypothetical protein
MGINTHVYSYWGVRTEWNDELSNDWEDQYKNPDNVDALFDCYSAEYMVFGVQLYDSGDARWGEMYNSNEVDIYPEKLDTLRYEYMQQFKKLYPQHYEWLAEKPWRLVNLVHLS